MRKRYLIFIAVFVILVVGYTFRVEISTIYVKTKAIGELRKKLHDPSSLQVVEFLVLYGANAKEFDKIPKGLI